METIIIQVKAAKSDKVLFERILQNQTASSFDFQSTISVLFSLFPDLETQISFRVTSDKHIQIPVFV